MTRTSKRAEQRLQSVAVDRAVRRVDPEIRHITRSLRVTRLLRGDLRYRIQIRDPGKSRSAPDLFLGPQFRSLDYGAHAEVKRLRIGYRCCINARPTFRAERLRPFRAAFRGLYINVWLASE